MPFLVVPVLVILVICLAKCVRIVPQAHAYVIEFLGSYTKTLGNGLHILIPFVERVANKVVLMEQVEDFPPQPVITKDNVTIQIDSVVYYTIFNPELFTYGVRDPLMALGMLTATTLRNIIGEMELDETLTSRDQINAKMTSTLDKATDAWGIKVSRVELKNIVPPRDIQEVMERQLRAERAKRQQLLEAEAHQKSVVMKAEGDKQALILRAEAQRDSAIAKATGEAESIRLVYEAEAAGLERLSGVGVSAAVLQLKQLEALKGLGDGRATKLVVPTDLAGSASMLAYLGDVLSQTVKPADNTPKQEPDSDAKTLEMVSQGTRSVQSPENDMAPDKDVQHEFRFEDGVQPGTVPEGAPQRAPSSGFQQRRRPPQAN